MQAPGWIRRGRQRRLRARRLVREPLDDQMGELKSEEFNVPFDLLLGRRTDEIFAGY
jgi:hypothetical protein